MTTRDYTRDIGNRAVSPRVPLPVAMAVLAIAGGSLAVGVMQLHSKKSARQMAEELPAAKPAARAHGMQR